MKVVLSVAMLLSIATIAFAEGTVPVYDADNFSPQIETAPPAESTISSASAEPESQPIAQMDASSGSTQQRMSRLEQQINNLKNSNSSARVNSLQNEVQSLRGQVEELNHQIQQLQNQVRTNYSDLDKRLNRQPTNLAKQVAESDSITPKSGLRAVKAGAKDKSDETKQVNQPNVAEEQQIYQTAYNYIKVKKYNEAVTALQGMLKKYPSGQFAANAHYWLGELYGLMNKNDQSAAEFGIVVKNYPDSPKVSDAQLKLGLIYAAQQNWSDAKASFKKVINKYPASSSARVASEQLKQIKLAGH